MNASDLTVDSFPLAPMQAGMLFNSASLPGSGVDLLLGVVRIEEEVDPERMRAAWQAVTEAHPALRSGMRWRELEQPLQFVEERVDLPFETADWSDVPPEDREARWEAFLRDDRRRGFELERAPLWRVTLVRFGPGSARLSWPIHHALLDTLAMVTLLRQVFGTYDALGRGETYEIEAGVSQRAFSDWYAGFDVPGTEPAARELLEGIEDASRRALTRESPLEEPADVQERALRVLTPESTARLVAWCKQQGTSMNTVLQGAWALLLARYGGSRKVVFGAVKSSRRSCMEGGDGMVGLALNTLPFLVEVDPEQPLPEFLRSLRERWVALRGIEHTPLVRLKEWSGLEARTPLFETVLCFDPYPYADALAKDGADWSRRHFDIFGQPDAPLTINAYGGERLQVRMTYDRRHFEGAAIERMQDHLAATLEAICRGAESRLGALDVLPAEEREALLEQSRGPAPPDAAEACLHDLFAAAVERHADSIALEHGEQRLTYREVAARSRRLAHALAESGVERGHAVGVSCGRSIDAIVAVLGVLEAGAAYVPLDAGDPPARLRGLVRDARPTCLVGNAGTTERLAELGVRTVCLDRDAAHLASRSAERVATGCNPADLAYLLFTSGSTGRPKCVAMPHAPLGNLVRWQVEQSARAERNRTAQFAPLVFDVSCQELFSTFAAGGTLCLVDEDVRREPRALLRWLAASGITRLFVPFVALQGLVEAAAEGEVTPSALREVVTAGEQLRVGPELRAFFRSIPGAALVNQYGPTETHVVTAWQAPPDPATWPALPPIGRPIPGARALVLSEGLQLAPAGAVGELVLGGRAVSDGYHGDPERTAERFVPDPFGPGPSETGVGARLYRTGDLARVDEDGQLHFLGRADRQVKLRGFRVEPGEVEAAMAGHPGVTQAAVAVRGQGSRDRQLIAYFVGTADPAELREHLAARLPSFQVPAACVPLDELPLTRSGKLDRRALPDVHERPSTREYEAPATDTERTLATIWSELLHVDRAGRTDDFFELGGHSLLAMRVAGRVRDRFDVELPLQRIFEEPTLAGLAEHLDDLRWAAGAALDGPSPSEGDDEELEF